MHTFAMMLRVHRINRVASVELMSKTCNGTSNQCIQSTLIFGVYYPSYMVLFLLLLLLTHNYPWRYIVNALHVFIVDFITLIMSRCLAKCIFLRWHNDIHYLNIFNVQTIGWKNRGEQLVNSSVNNLYALNWFSDVALKFEHNQILREFVRGYCHKRDMRYLVKLQNK